MAAGVWTPTATARTKILNGQFVSGDAWKCALFLSTSNLTTASTTFAGVTNEHAAAFGYTAGGITVGPFTLSGTTTVTADFTTDPIWTASGGSIVARWAAIYEVAGDVFAFCLLEAVGPADVTTTTGNTLTISTPSAVFSLA